MFKKTSQSTQSRVFRTATESRKNEAGIDPASFQGKVEESLESRKNRIIREKMQAETKLAMLNNSIAQAKNNFTTNSRNQAGYDFLAKAQSQRGALIRKVSWCQRQVAEIKREELAQRNEEVIEEQRFSDVFMEMAREMLAEPVYNRIMVAAVHRQRESRKR